MKPALWNAREGQPRAGLPPKRGHGRSPALRGSAIFFGTFSSINFVWDLAAARFDATLWWIDVRFLPASFATMFLALLGPVLIAWALFPMMSKARSLLTDAALLAGVGISVANTLGYFLGYFAGSFHARFPFPLALIVAALFACLFLLRPLRSPPVPAFAFKMIAWVLVWALAFPFLQMVLYGTTSYTRQADAAVVFGAAVYGDGRMSHALYDRTRTAVLLQRSGVVRALIFSGGPGPARGIHETDAMRRYAIKSGVPARSIIVDREGLSTRDSVRNTTALFHKYRLKTVLAVSHFYHLPRIKLSYQRLGQMVYTVPATETFPLRNTPRYMLREVAALWAYYLWP